QEYQVRITYERDARNRDNLVVSCTCAYFADYARCKHLWAVILEAGRRHALLSAEYARVLRVEREGGASDGPLPKPARVYEMPQRVQRTPPWQEYLKQIQTSVDSKKPEAAWPADLNLLYVIDASASRHTGASVLELYSRTRKKSGEWTAWKEFRVSAAKAGSLPDAADADIVPELLGATDTFAFNYSATYASSMRKALPHVLALKLLPRAAAAGRLAVRNSHTQEFQAIAWDEGPPWHLLLEVRQDERDQWAIEGVLARGEDRIPLTEPVLIVPGGFVIARDRIARIEDTGQFAWIEQLLSIR